MFLEYSKIEKTQTAQCCDDVLAEGDIEAQGWQLRVAADPGSKKIRLPIKIEEMNTNHETDDSSMVARTF
jgi:hypothetical protein